jgi:hydrogenase small subunit
MLRRGVSRRAFLKFAAAMTATLALPEAYAPRVAAAVQAAPRIPVIWVRGQSCTGNTEAFFQASNPSVAQLMLDMLSIDYQDALMASAGDGARQSLYQSIASHPNGYIAVIEGAVPTADGGVYCTIGGRAFRDVVADVTASAVGTIAVGSCAFDGGAAAAAGGSTGAAGVAQVVSDARMVNLPGCPVNVENLAATIVHYLTYKQFPVTDSRHRPLFAYGGLIHNQCERRAHFEFGEFVQSWGDEAAQKGWCLYKMGCKGPETFANCATVKYASATSWSVLAGHGCIGCTMPHFWDAMGPAYKRLPGPVPFIPSITADQVGQALVGGVGALTVVHGSASVVRQKRKGYLERRAAKRAAAAEASTDDDAPSTETARPIESAVAVAFMPEPAAAGTDASPDVAAAPETGPVGPEAEA